MDETFRFNPDGRPHRDGDRSCAGCETFAGKEYPREHRTDGAACSGLIHSEKMKDEAGKHLIMYLCDRCGYTTRSAVRK